MRGLAWFMRRIRSRMLAATSGLPGRRRDFLVQSVSGSSIALFWHEDVRRFREEVCQNGQRSNVVPDVKVAHPTYVFFQRELFLHAGLEGEGMPIPHLLQNPA